MTNFLSNFPKSLFKLNKLDFRNVCIDVFQYQCQYNPLYSSFVEELGINPKEVTSISQIPFMPISFFKEHDVKSGSWKEVKTFQSSGTTGLTTSKHQIKQLEDYRDICLHNFYLFYPEYPNMTILALLPSYLEQGNSSLIYMVDQLISSSTNKNSGYYLKQAKDLPKILSEQASKGQKVLLIGVTYALLELAELVGDIDLNSVIFMETGGMKGRRKEITRQEVHKQLMSKFSLSSVHSEYGMTELMSQAYSHGQGRFNCPPWMKVLAREINDPFNYAEKGRTGVLNIIDLGNLYTCSFIATDDLGIVHEDSSFEVLGRMDNTDLRGCNLLLSL